MAWRAIPGPLSKRKRRLDSLEAVTAEAATGVMHLLTKGGQGSRANTRTLTLGRQKHTLSIKTESLYICVSVGLHQEQMYR